MKTTIFLLIFTQILWSSELIHEKKNHLTLQVNYLKLKKNEQLKVLLTPEDPFHFNLNYPIKVVLKPTCLNLEKTRFDKDDATHFEDDKITFNIPLKKRCTIFSVKGTVTVGICKPNLCQRAVTDFSLKLKIKKE